MVLLDCAEIWDPSASLSQTLRLPLMRLDHEVSPTLNFLMIMLCVLHSSLSVASKMNETPEGCSRIKYRKWRQRWKFISRWCDVTWRYIDCCCYLTSGTSRCLSTISCVRHPTLLHSPLSENCLLEMPFLLRSSIFHCSALQLFRTLNPTLIPPLYCIYCSGEWRQRWWWWYSSARDRAHVRYGGKQSVRLMRGRIGSDRIAWVQQWFSLSLSLSLAPHLCNVCLRASMQIGFGRTHYIITWVLTGTCSDTAQ